MTPQVTGHKEILRFDLTFFKTIRFHTHGLDAATVENVKPLGLDPRLRQERNGQQRSESKRSRLADKDLARKSTKSLGFMNKLSFALNGGLIRVLFKLVT